MQVMTFSDAASVYIFTFVGVEFSKIHNVSIFEIICMSVKYLKLMCNMIDGIK